MDTLTISEENIEILYHLVDYPTIKTLICTGLNLQEFNYVLPPNIVNLDLHNNQLSELHVNKFIEQLYCNENRLTTLTFSEENALLKLNCAENQLTTLDVHLCSKLNKLDCFFNSLTELYLNNNLEELNCAHNSLEWLDIKPSCNTLITVNCAYNLLLQIDGIEMCNVIQSLYCNNNRIIYLPIEKLANLKILNMANNQLTNIELPNLKELICTSNLLRELRTPLSLQFLSCGNNQIRNLIPNANLEMCIVSNNLNLNSLNLQACRKLHTLFCSNCGLNNLLLPKSLINLTCINNKLTILDVSKCKKLQNLNVSKNSINELKLVNYNELISLKVSENNIKLHLEKLPKLEILFANKITSFYTNELIKFVGDFPSLEKVSVVGNKLDFLTIFEKLTNLKEIFFSNNNVSRVNWHMFPNLEILSCGENKFTNFNLDLLRNLKFLSISNNRLTDLTLKNRDLTLLYCDKCDLQSLTLYTPLLSFLKCSRNKLQTLDLSTNKLLHTLSCNNNRLYSLTLASKEIVFFDVSTNTHLNIDISDQVNLVKLDITNTKVNVQDFNNFTDLEVLFVSNFGFHELNISRLVNLKSLDCSFNALRSLDVSNLGKLETLRCQQNLLSTLNLTENHKLNSLWCMYNNIEELLLSPTLSIKLANISNNLLTTLPFTEEQLRYCTRLELSFNKITFTPEQRRIILREEAPVSIFEDRQNVHDTTIVNEVDRSFEEIKSKYQPQPNSLQKLLENPLVTGRVKSIISAYAREKQPYEHFGTNFEETLNYIYPLHDNNSIENLNIEFSDKNAHRICYTGRFTHLINSLVGKVPEARVNMTENQQLLAISYVVNKDQETSERYKYQLLASRFKKFVPEASEEKINPHLALFKTGGNYKLLVKRIMALHPELNKAKVSRFIKEYEDDQDKQLLQEKIKISELPDLLNDLQSELKFEKALYAFWELNPLASEKFIREIYNNYLARRNTDFAIRALHEKYDQISIDDLKSWLANL